MLTMARSDHLQPILYQNSERTVTLIDIPLSLSAAQGTGDCPAIRVLRSSEPRAEPYSIANEPKSQTARDAAAQNTVDEDLHGIYRSSITAALEEIKANISGGWCTVRHITSSSKELRGRKCKAEELHDKVRYQKEHLRLDSSNEAKSTIGAASDVPSSFFSALICSSSDSQATFSTAPPRFHEQPCWDEGVRGDTTLVEVTADESWESSYHNAHIVPIYMSVRLPADQGLGSVSRIFIVPPLSSFLLGNCLEASNFRHTVRSFAQDYDAPRRFDFILLDPPWPNASVRRKSAYATEPTLDDLDELITQMDLDTLNLPNGLIGVWITNKPAVRSLILDEGGVFYHLNAQLIEEWIWVKTTTNGEPISPLDSLWRKPYEILLLGRMPANQWAPQEETPEVKRRVIAGVPDLHSRKPCLKGLISQLMPDAGNYTALEIFSRNLVSGWWSWGNEVLKFNWEGCYSDRKDDPEAAG